jgi:hypothetical protein
VSFLLEQFSADFQVSLSSHQQKTSKKITQEKNMQNPVLIVNGLYCQFGYEIFQRWVKIS